MDGTYVSPDMRCLRILERYCNLTGERVAKPSDMATERWEGALTLHSESGVKRLVRGSGSSGLRDVGPGFSTWGDLEYFLRGMEEAATIAKYGF